MGKLIRLPNGLFTLNLHIKEVSLSVHHTWVTIII